MQHLDGSWGAVSFHNEPSIINELRNNTIMFIVDKQDKSKLSGVWQEFESAEFLVASVQHAGFSREFDKIKDKKYPNTDHQTTAYIRLIAKYLLLNWRGVYNSDGEEVEYNQSNAEWALKESAELRNWVMEAAANTETYMKDGLDDLVKK